MEVCKTDFAERILHLDVRFHEEMYNNYAVHNMCTIICDELVHSTLEER